MGVIHAEQFDQYIDNVGRRLQSEPMPQAMEECRTLMQEGQRANFIGQKSRTGAPWPARKPPTGAWPLLNETGRLQDAATGAGAGSISETGGRTVAVGVNPSASNLGGVKAAVFHQKGTSRMPARPFLGANDETETDMGEEIGRAGLRFFDG